MRSNVSIMPFSQSALLNRYSQVCSFRPNSVRFSYTIYVCCILNHSPLTMSTCLESALLPCIIIGIAVATEGECPRISEVPTLITESEQQKVNQLSKSTMTKIIMTARLSIGHHSAHKLGVIRGLTSPPIWHSLGIRVSLDPTGRSRHRNHYNPPIGGQRQLGNHQLLLIFQRCRGCNPRIGGTFGIVIAHPTYNQRHAGRLRPYGSESTTSPLLGRIA